MVGAKREMNNIHNFFLLYYPRIFVCGIKEKLLKTCCFNSVRRTCSILEIFEILMLLNSNFIINSDAANLQNLL